MNKLKRLAIAGAFLFNLAYAEENISLADSPKENVKMEFQLSLKYEDSGKYVNAIAHLIKAKKYNLFTEIIDAKISSVKKKITYVNDEKCNIGIANFNNSSSDNTLPSLIINKLNEYALSNNNVSYTSKSLENQITSEFTNVSQSQKDIDLIITGDIIDHRIEEHVNVNTKSTQYASGKSRIPNQRYNELTLETNQLYTAWQNAKAKSEDRKNDSLLWGGGKAALGAVIGSDSMVKDGLTRMGTGLVADAVLSDADSLKRAYEQKKRELESTSQYHEETNYAEYGYDIENHIKEGTLKLAIKIIDPSSNKIIFNKSVDEYVKDEDAYQKGFSPAGIREDPLNLKTNQKIREELIDRAIKGTQIDIKDELEHFKKKKLLSKIKKASKEEALELHLKNIYLFGASDEEYKEFTNLFSNISRKSFSPEALKVFFK